MKSKIIGLVILLVVILGAGAYVYVQNNNQPPLTIKGFVGGEKIGLFQDEQVQSILEKEYNLAFDYTRAGSLDMITASHEDKQFLFPSSQTALDLYQRKIGKPYKDEIIFNTPIVLYSRKPVVDALMAEGLISEKSGVYFMDMDKLVKLMLSDSSWAEVGLPELYGTVTVATTDPTKSNSGNMFAGLLANVIHGNIVASKQDLTSVMPKVKGIFDRMGYMESSSGDLFEQFLRTGMGAKPLVVGYENQILEFAATNPEDWQNLKQDILIVYPVPTVWSTHIYLALDETGAKGIDALLDDNIQKIAWDRHGFRTGVYDSGDLSQFQVDGVSQDVTQIIPMPNADIMNELIETIH